MALLLRIPIYSQIVFQNFFIASATAQISLFKDRYSHSSIKKNYLQGKKLCAITKKLQCIQEGSNNILSELYSATTCRFQEIK